MARQPVSYRSGSIEAGLENGRKLLEAKPAAAALQARALLRAEPRNTAAHRLFAQAMAALGRSEDARMARARAVQFSREVPALTEAHRATLAGHPERVEALLRDHLALYPDDPVALMIDGEALARIGRAREAVRRFEAALAFMPEYVEARMQLVRVHQQYFDPAAALAALEPLLADRPGLADLHRWKASLLSNLGQHTLALESLATAAALEPANPDIRVSIGDEQRTLGAREQAEAAYRGAGASMRAWWGLAALGRRPFDGADMAAMRAMLSDAARDPELPYLHFALAVGHEQAGERSDAFRHFAAGNALKAAAEPFDAVAVEAEVARSRRLLTPALFAERGGDGCPAPDPIFIVGMPRSGSTLVEQVLASHPQIEGTAELPILPALVRIMGAEHGLAPGGSYRTLLPGLPASELTRIGEEYLRLARPHRKTDRPYFLDKLPHNWADAGFIRLILPRARIVDMRRAPMDVCWSNFRLLFARGHPASNSLGGMAAYYRSYVAMMADYDAAMPGAIHRVIYERLVDDFEPEVRRLLDHVGVPFDPACLDFHKTARPVATASSEQVRRPLNRDGIGAWRAYAAWLGPLEEAVGDLERTYAG
ncbi:MAG: sulfotransferase [Novosphingobium sp.]|nr:sulfotransferase [Novosphingobium sp.]MBO9601686.1 sulfotransferase [Novosphingobium sp.]